jgi:hypothetical protein
MRASATRRRTSDAADPDLDRLVAAPGPSSLASAMTGDQFRDHALALAPVLALAPTTHVHHALHRVHVRAADHALGRTLRHAARVRHHGSRTGHQATTGSPGQAPTSFASYLMPRRSYPWGRHSFLTYTVFTTTATPLRLSLTAVPTGTSPTTRPILSLVLTAKPTSRWAWLAVLLRAHARAMSSCVTPGLARSSSLKMFFS